MNSKIRGVTGYPLRAQVVDRKIWSSAGEAPCVTRFLRSRTILVAWSVAERGGAHLSIDSQAEYFLLLPNVGATVLWKGGEFVVPVRSVCILPEGATTVRLDGAGECLRLFSPVPGELDLIKVFGAPALDQAVTELQHVHSYRRTGPTGAPVAYNLDTLANSPGMPRAKLFQSATMSINWVEYDGPRDRQRLSPHSHVDIEQASIAIEGDFVHHLRTSWTPDANDWWPDEHIGAGGATVALIPPPIIHTSEGVGPGRHILIDVFAPPRGDFIAKGQILNSADYLPP